MIERNHDQHPRLVAASGSFWVAAQAIRATSLMSGVSVSSGRMDTPDGRTTAQRNRVSVSGRRFSVGDKADTPQCEGCAATSQHGAPSIR